MSIEVDGEPAADGCKVLVERHPAVAREVQTQQDERGRLYVTQFLLETTPLTHTVVSALAVAVQLMDSATANKAGKPLKYDRRIIIVTDGRGDMDTDDLDAIASKIKDEEAPIEITLLGVDFDDSDYGYKEEDKNVTKVRKLP